MRDRFYVSETSGFVYADSNHWEHEYAVVDEDYGTVGLFIVNVRGEHSLARAANEARAAKRAERMCTALNHRERGVAYDPRALEPPFGRFPIRWARRREDP